MIYRIQIDEGVWEFVEEEDNHMVTRYHLRGPSGELSDVMWELNLPVPKTNFVSHRARFYFTERGWKQIGRHLAAEAKRRGHVVKVIRRKNPADANIAYADELQIALLPARKKGGRARGPDTGA